MYVMSRVFLSLTLLASLSSCERGYTIDVPPATVGHVSFRGDGGAWRDANLTQQQVLLISDWMKAHQAEWHSLMETPPPGTFRLELEASSGRKYTMQVFVQPSGGGTVYAYGYDYRADQHYPLKRRVSDSDIQELRAAAGIAAS